MKLAAFKAIDLDRPLRVFEGTLYSGRSSLQFFQLTKNGIDIVTPDPYGSKKKKVLQSVIGKISGGKTSEVDWKKSTITGITQYDVFSQSSSRSVEWQAAGFVLKGADVVAIGNRFKEWYNLPKDSSKWKPSDYSRYFDILKSTQALIQEKLFAGEDEIVGSDERDVLSGGKGKDVITGKGGADQLRGGDGPDSFAYLSLSDSGASFGSVDTIVDFNGLQGDRIDLRKIGANARKLTFIGANEFSGSAGEIRFAAGSLSVDVNGDRVSELDVNIPGVDSFQAGFLLI